MLTGNFVLFYNTEIEEPDAIMAKQPCMVTHGTYVHMIVLVIILGFKVIILVKYLHIREYGSTLYIGIAMVVLPYILTMGILEFQFSLQIPLNLISINIKVEKKLMISENLLENLVILVIWTFTESV